MVKKHRPRWGYRVRGWFPEGREPFFDQSSFERLATTYDIPEHLHQKVFEQLEGSGDIYSYHRTNVDDRPTPSEQAAALREIGHLAAKLSQRLEDLDDATTDAFWRIASHQPHPFEAETETPFGHKIERIDMPDEGFLLLCDDEESIRRSIRIIQNVAAHVEAGLPQAQGGPSGSEGIRMWVLNMVSLWEEILGRKFTLDYHQGQPISDAARFTVEALQVIDPNVPTSRIVTGMRKVTKYRRERNLKMGGSK